MPAHEAARFVGEALLSILGQTYHKERLEVIVVDDGSKDQTAAIAATVLKRSAIRHQVVSTDNHGPSHARNVGAGLANGEWIQFLDADDVLSPEKVAHQAAFAASSHERVGVVYSPWQIIENSGTGWSPVSDIIRPDASGDAVLKLLRSDNFLQLGSLLFRRRWLDKVGGFNAKRWLIEDVELLLRLAMAGVEFVRADSEKPLFFYRQHQSSLSKRDPVAFMDGCVSNARLVEAYWRGPEIGLTSERRTVLLEVYGCAARYFYEADRERFAATYRHLLALDTHFLPIHPRSLRVLSRLIGYPGAEAVALNYRKLKRFFCGAHG